MFSQPPPSLEDNAYHVRVGVGIINEFVEGSQSQGKVPNLYATEVAGARLHDDLNRCVSHVITF
jgi:hypothetical protein